MINLSFVIIEYLCLDQLFSCISSIKEKCLDLSYEIIVSSNSVYPEEKKALLKSKFSDIKWVFNETNLGFAKGMNRGIMKAESECIVITNPDVRIITSNLKSAYDYLMSQSDIGIIGPKIVDYQGNLQDSCRKFLTPFGLFTRTIKRVMFKTDVLLEPHFNYNEVQPVDWVIGAFMILKRKALEKVGLLDESYFLYVEDMDWCKRFWDQGYKVVYYPDLIVKYKGDRKSTSFLTGQKNSKRYFFYHLKSYLRFLMKHKILI